MNRHPSVRNEDVDHFEERLKAFVATATPDELREAVYRASVYVEQQAENGTAANHITQINNATSTFCTVTTQLIKRLAEAEKGNA